MEVVKLPRLVKAGIQFTDGEFILSSSGQPIKPNEQYTLLINDFMYAGGDGLTEFAEYDPNAYNTAINWRQPIIDWILSQESNAGKPLDTAMQSWQ